MGVASSEVDVPKAIRLHMIFEDQLQRFLNSHPNDEKTTVNILSTRGKEKERAAKQLRMMVLCNCMY